MSYSRETERNILMYTLGLFGANGIHWVNHDPDSNTNEQCLVSAIVCASREVTGMDDATGLYLIKRILGDVDLVNWNDTCKSFDPIRQVIMEAFYTI